MKLCWPFSAINRALCFSDSRCLGETGSDARDCFYWDDCVALGAAVFLGGGPMVLLARRLLKVNDAFKLREELALTLGICSVLAGKIH